MIQQNTAKKTGILGSMGRAGMSNVGRLLPAGFMLWTAADAYKGMRDKGVNPMLAAPAALASAAVQNAFMWPVLTASLLPILPMAQQAMRERIGAQQRQIMPMNQWSDDSWDTPQLQTTRQRSLDAIQSSRMNARQFIGNEASLFHNRYR